MNKGWAQRGYMSVLWPMKSPKHAIPKPRLCSGLLLPGPELLYFQEEGRSPCCGWERPSVPLFCACGDLHVLGSMHSAFPFFYKWPRIMAQQGSGLREFQSIKHKYRDSKYLCWSHLIVRAEWAATQSSN